MKWVILLWVVAVTAVCFVRAKPLPNETLDEFEDVVMNRIASRLSEVMRQLYAKSDRYDLASQVLRTVSESLSKAFYSGK
ncbi:unnamed protein product [Larinioides sclopetarius]|uniref:Uncharacterized protein n=1 Tax=Larinioides sclopetarius TaxID=280406 RepID=A0AAV2A2W5_9ARAC